MVAMFSQANRHNCQGADGGVEGRQFSNGLFEKSAIIYTGAEDYLGM
jgi:hypothetical protein